MKDIGLPDRDKHLQGPFSGVAAVQAVAGNLS